MTHSIAHRLGALTCLGISIISNAYDNPHFYRATNLLPEARISKPMLTTLDFSLGFGSTHSGRNHEGNKVPLFDIYGPNNMHELGVNVPNKNLANTVDLLLTQLSLLPSRENFAQLSIGGEFTIIEGIINAMHNLDYGFFLQAYLPIRHLSVKNTCFKDLSPVDAGCPNRSNQLWQSFLALFDTILDQYCLSRNNVTETGVGDLTTFLGYTYNYQNSTALDFIDFTIRFGALFPTGKKRNENEIFSLPLGYNGHYAFDFPADIAIGVLDWLTLGLHGEGLIFVHKEKTIRIKTAPHQSGIIKLAQAKVKVQQGPLWVIAPFIKADHVVRGLSVLLGYSFVKKNSEILQFPCDSQFDACVANTDRALQGFTMHTINVYVDYDFCDQDCDFLPRLGFFFNSPIMGNQIFNTNMVGPTFGFDFDWSF